MKKIVLKRVAVCIIIFVTAVMLGVALGSYVSRLRNQISTETGYEAYILDHWNENYDKEYKLGITAYVQVEDLGWRLDGDGEHTITAVYTIYNEDGRQIGCGYMPEVFK